jgi:small subunit ribosomal protein S1
VQTVIENPEARTVEGSNGLLLEIDGEIVPNYEATFRTIEEGEVVTGHVVRIDKDEVLVDIGYKSEGVIPASELSIRKSVDPSDEVHLGEEVDAIVLTKEDQDGRLIMSKKRARFEKAWRRIETAAESGEPVEGTVIEVVKGGLIIDLGVRGFLPASLVDIRRVPNLDEYMGTKIETKVIELNRSRNNVVLSRRAVLEEERKEVRQQILDRLQPGLVVEGQISNIVDFGAFVDLDGIDGLIHISELSWSHVNHPSEILTIGDTVKVKVLDIDRDRQRISLGLKQTQEDPWQRIVDTYNVNDELEGKVTKVVTFGAFVEILDGVEGLVHISELAPHHVESPREIVHPGDEIRVRILEIDSERRRLSLSAKRVEDQILPVARAHEPGGEPTAADEAETAETTAATQAAPETGEVETVAETGTQDDGLEAGEPQVVAEASDPQAGEPEAVVEAGEAQAGEPEAVVEAGEAQAGEPEAVVEAGEAQAGEQEAAQEAGDAQAGEPDAAAEAGAGQTGEPEAVVDAPQAPPAAEVVEAPESPESAEATAASEAPGTAEVTEAPAAVEPDEPADRSEPGKPTPSQIEDGAGNEGGQPAVESKQD